MDVRTLRLLIADARKAGVDFVPMKIRTVEDLADLIEQMQYDIDTISRGILDDFAMAALNQRKMLSTGAWYASDAAREAYEIADAMMAERQSRLSADDQPTKES